ncbi:helix-turn-helix transcriptional regulator [Caulobacter sp. S45]|uniref:helix-turn-helix domain-containing protein n=1 Tax=Caulobacter sp. S45 TaxID=1641861 RepID=UPI0015758A26|nr:helix-turn-helix transcriptional regulator [Caulobacter sp. S45]
MSVRLHLDALLHRRRMSLAELSDRVGISPANLSLLKLGQARAIRFTTLAALCRELECQPGDLLTYGPGADHLEDGEA